MPKKGFLKSIRIFDTTWEHYGRFPCLLTVYCVIQHHLANQNGAFNSSSNVYFSIMSALAVVPAARFISIRLLKKKKRYCFYSNNCWYGVVLVFYKEMFVNLTKQSLQDFSILRLQKWTRNQENAAAFGEACIFNIHIIVHSVMFS